ncbi:MAG: L17 family ribosomal protein [Eubacteriales bacterium]|nr:L17 family ribosomal protein [Eubacteriales bacterium]
MSGYRQLSRPSDQRKALLKQQLTSLLVNGELKTTKTRALEVQKMAEKIITLAVREQDNFDEVEVKKSAAKLDGKGRKILQTATSKAGNKYDKVEREITTETVKKDRPSRLAARRQIIAQIYEFKDENGERINTANHVFDELAPRYRDRKGGYTRIIRLGQRRGDAAEMVLLQLV